MLAEAEFITLLYRKVKRLVHIFRSYSNSWDQIAKILQERTSIQTVLILSKISRHSHIFEEQMLCSEMIT